MSNEDLFDSNVLCLLRYRLLYHLIGNFSGRGGKRLDLFRRVHKGDYLLVLVRSSSSPASADRPMNETYSIMCYRFGGRILCGTFS